MRSYALPACQIRRLFLARPRKKYITNSGKARRGVAPGRAGGRAEGEERGPQHVAGRVTATGPWPGHGRPRAATDKHGPLAPAVPPPGPGCGWRRRAVRVGGKRTRAGESSTPVNPRRSVIDTAGEMSRRACRLAAAAHLRPPPLLTTLSAAAAVRQLGCARRESRARTPGDVGQGARLVRLD